MPVSEYWIYKGNYHFLSSIKHPRPPRLSGSRWRAGSIQYLSHSGKNVRFKNFVFLITSLLGL
jgi:hypothetical protein